MPAKGVLINNRWQPSPSGKIIRRGIELPDGMKKSGHGHEKGFAALHNGSQLRTTITKHN